MSRFTIPVFYSLGILLVLLSIVGFIPHIKTDYNATSMIFILGLVFLVAGFLLHQQKRNSGESREVFKTANVRRTRKSKKKR